MPPKKRRHADEAKPARTGKGKTAETAALLVEMLGEVGIDALLGMVTGGASAAAKLGSKGGKVLKYADDVGDLAKRKYAGAYEKIDDFLAENNYIDDVLYKNNVTNEDNIVGTLKNAAGKTIIEVKHAPGEYKANSILQVKNKKGGLDRDYYDDKGKFSKQISNNSHNHKKEAGFGLHGEHAHDHYLKNGKQVHGAPRELTYEERKENSDFL